MTDNQLIRQWGKEILSKTFPDKYESIWNIIEDEVINDVKECADKDFTSGDVEIAIVRAVLNHLEDNP